MSENNEKLEVTTEKEEIKDNSGSNTSAVVGSVFFIIGIAIFFVAMLCLFLYLLTK